MDNQNNTNEIQPVKIILRDTEASDFEAVRDIFSKEYGDSYAVKAVYDADAFAKLIKTKGIHSIVAQTEDGRIAGHHALREWALIPDVYEGGMAVVNPDIRKCGAFNKMMEANNAYFDDVIKKGIQISGATMVHEITQKTRLKFGFTPCGFLYNAMPKGWGTINFDTGATRMGEALSVHVADHSPKTLYVPEDANELINKVCEGENLPRTLINDEPEISEEVTVIKKQITADEKISKAVILKIGKDYKYAIKQLVHDLKANESDVCHVMFSAENPGTTAFYKEALKYGMHLCAYIPNTGYGDLLVVGYELNNLIEYDHLITIGPYADMMQLIRKFDPMDM